MRIPTSERRGEGDAPLAKQQDRPASFIYRIDDVTKNQRTIGHLPIASHHREHSSLRQVEQDPRASAPLGRVHLAHQKNGQREERGN